MIGFLRFVALVNAAIWFGGAIFFTFGIGQASFSPEMKALLGPNNYPYFSGAIAQIFVSRYFALQAICSVVACAHLLAEWLYLGKQPERFRLFLLVGMCSAALLGGFWLQPKMKALHTIKYSTTSKPGEREVAARYFGRWHGVSMSVNLLLVIGVGVYLWRLANAPDPTRFVSSIKFHS